MKYLTFLLIAVLIETVSFAETITITPVNTESDEIEIKRDDASDN